MPNSEQVSFYGLGIAPSILAIIEKLGFKVPTPIQTRSIPPAIEGKDLIGLAQTGTGKTLAFGIPLVQAALSGKKSLVVLPTRELALQVDEELKKIGSGLGVRTALLIGGGPMGGQIRDLRRNPAVVIGTPGRILDHMRQRTVSFRESEILVLDEADRMLDMGFAPQLRQILTEVPKERQTMLFSATMPDEIVKMANAYMRLPLRIEMAPSGTAVKSIIQELFFVAKLDKPRLLEKVLYDYKGPVLVFSKTKFGAKRIAAGLRALGHTASEIHSNRTLNQRREALDGFKNGRYRILVATDIAARGIDVKGIELVLNYDLPTNPEDYVHRIGRTARAGAVGRAISFATPDQRGDVRDIERLMRTALPLSRLPELPPARHLPKDLARIAPDSRRPGRSRRSAHPAGGERRPASRFGRRTFSTSRPGSQPPKRRF